MSKIFSICISFFLLTATPATSFALKPWLGHQKALVLLIEWPDQKANISPQEVEKVFFEDNNYSLRQYFLENSIGAFDLSGKVMTWRLSQNPWATFGDGCNPSAIAGEALKLFVADIDPSQYDSDRNGKIDNLFVIHSGRIASDRVGPDCVFGYNNTADNVAVFQSEGLGSVGQAIPIGFFVHEGGHMYFGLPDLYEDHFHGKYGIGMWGVMGLGCWGTSNETPREHIFGRPSHFEPLSKIKIGWVKPTLIAESRKAVRIRPVEQFGDIVQIPVGNHDSYFMEYRRGIGFSHGHKGQGMLLWRNYHLIQADGRDDLSHGHNNGVRPLPPTQENFGDASDPFPGSMNVTMFSDSDTKVMITNIHQTTDWIEFDVSLPPSSSVIQRDLNDKPGYDLFNGEELL